MTLTTAMNDCVCARCKGKIKRGQRVYVAVKERYCRACGDALRAQAQGGSR